jgi:hypothetical protein
MYRQELHDSHSGKMQYRECNTIIDSYEGNNAFMIAENGLWRNARESWTQANMMNNRGSFMVNPFTMIGNTKHWYDEGGDSACPLILPLRIVIMT